MLRLVSFYLIFILVCGREARSAELCRSIDYISLYDRLDLIGVSVSSLIVKPLSVHVRASPMPANNDRAWPEAAAVILFDELPPFVRRIELDDQTETRSGSARLYTASAFRNPAEDFPPGWMKNIREISVADGTLRVTGDDLTEADYPEMTMRLSGMLGKNQGIKSLAVDIDGRALYVNPDVRKWQRIAGQADILFLERDNFFYSSIEAAGKHLMIKIPSRDRTAGRNIQPRHCFEKNNNLHRFSTFSTITVP